MMHRGNTIPRRKKALFAFAATVLSLVALEGAARLVEAAWPMRRVPLPTPGDNYRFMHEMQSRRLEDGSAIPMIANLQRRWAMAPGELLMDKHKVRINAAGLRGPELTSKKTGEVRILTLGDSSIFGASAGERDVFSAVAASRLSRLWRRRVAAVNGGIPGYDSGQSLALLREVGRKVQPDLVVIGNIWSDIYSSEKGVDLQAGRGSLPWPLTHLALCRRIQNVLEPAPPAPRKVRFLGSRDDVGAVDGSGVPPRVLPNAYRENLDAMARQARSLGARPVFLLLPAPMDFDAVPPPRTITRYRGIMSRVAALHDAPLLDGRKVFGAVGSGFWFVDQVHPSPEGHHLLGRALADLLARHAPGRP